MSWPWCGTVTRRAHRASSSDLTDRGARAAFIAAATDIVRALAVPGHRDEDTWVNILHARDGAWGVGGQALTNDDLVAGIMAAAMPA
jgi:hypothetical protein